MVSASCMTISRRFRGKAFVEESVKFVLGPKLSKMNGGWMTMTLPTMIKTLRKIDRHVRALLRIILSMKTLNTGEVKLTTMRSPIGIKGTAVRKAKLIVETKNP